MRIVYGVPSAEFAKSHMRIPREDFIKRLTRVGTPLVYYAASSRYGALGTWAPCWAVQLVNDWDDIDFGEVGLPIWRSAAAENEGIITRVVAYVTRTGDESFAAAALSLYRLTLDVQSVHAMLTERKDLI
jgi:hypothetical protein